MECLKRNKYGNIPLDKKIIVSSPIDESDISIDSNQVELDLKKYKKMLDDGLISESDYEIKKKQILGID